MRKILIAALAASALIPTMASATSRNEIRNDRHEVKQDQRDVRKAVRNGNYRQAQQARQETREDRQELNEDWRSYRGNHRSTYQRGAYAAPAGYAYRPIRTGYRFGQAQYHSRYWLTNYASYRLPNPGYNHRWIRYGNDAVLIDTRSGVALRIINAFFL